MAESVGKTRKQSFKFTLRDGNASNTENEMEDSLSKHSVVLEGKSADQGTEPIAEKELRKPGQYRVIPMEAAVLSTKDGDHYDLNKSIPKDDGNLSADDTWRSVARSLLSRNAAEKDDSFDIATKDDVDAGSVYSLFMVKDFRYYFQHPYFRLFTAYFVTFCNFLIYAEDPVAHSRSECNIPVIGNDFSFVCKKYFPNAWNLLKVSLWVSGTVVGLLMGKIVFHTLVFSKYKSCALSITCNFNFIEFCVPF